MMESARRMARDPIEVALENDRAEQIEKVVPLEAFQVIFLVDSRLSDLISVDEFLWSPRIL